MDSKSCWSSSSRLEAQLHSAKTTLAALTFLRPGTVARGNMTFQWIVWHTFLFCSPALFYSSITCQCNHMQQQDWIPTRRISALYMFGWVWVGQWWPGAYMWWEQYLGWTDTCLPRWVPFVQGWPSWWVRVGHGQGWPSRWVWVVQWWPGTYTCDGNNNWVGQTPVCQGGR